MILREIKRILIAPLSWCCVFIYAAIMLVGISNELHYGETGWMDLFHLTENYGIARLAKCLIFPMGAAACYYDERIGHSDWLKMMRSGRFRYCLEKTAVTVLGCVFLYLTSVAVFMIIGSIINPRIVEVQRCGGMMQGGLWEKWANSGNYWATTFLYVLLYALQIAVFSMLGLCVSVFCAHRYIIAVLPFFLERFWLYVGARIFFLKFTLLENYLPNAGITQPDGGIVMCLARNLALLCVLFWCFWGELRWRWIHG